MTRFKICGLSTPETVDAAVAAGAFALGFVFFPPSPRHLGLDQARALIARVPAGIARVAVTVDADDALLDALLETGIDTLQLHGRESADRVAAVRARTRRPVWLARGVATAADIRSAIAAASPADALLLDAKAPADAPLPGGNGLAFDWRLLHDVRPPLPWGLSGGLDAETVAAALASVRPAFVDVSSGVETAPGIKSIPRIKAFAQAVSTA
ncbi:phosphoribosylanthranilate isomerase [Polymorphobacter sp.]|uniref:phosphoribosylanthranilate isomerase n=1 Tax=Polymorphobacter sp. TaxID=1909290 RepID=UPI003F71AC28